MDMAPGRRRRRGLLRGKRSVLVAVRDHDVGYLVYRFDVKRLFSPDDRRRRPREVLPLPRSHVACFRRPLRYPMDLAASPRGDKIVAASSDGHMMVYDAARCQYTYDQDLAGSWKRSPIILALSGSRRNDAAMSMLVPDLSNPADDRTLLRGFPPDVRRAPAAPPRSSAAGFAAVAGQVEGLRQLLYGHVPLRRRRARVAFRGRRGRGTYSYSLLNKQGGWRSEGSWVMPVGGRAVYAPDLGLLLGLSGDLRALCAVDMEARPPVIRQHWQWWPTLFPTEDEGYSEEQDYLCFDYGALAYLGGGRLCISWSSPYRSHGDRMMLALTAVELTPTTTSNGSSELLLLRKRRSRCYRLPPGNQGATVLPPSSKL